MLEEEMQLRLDRRFQLGGPRFRPSVWRKIAKLLRPNRTRRIIGARRQRDATVKDKRPIEPRIRAAARISARTSSA